MARSKTDKWTPLGDRARHARAVEAACVALLSALVKVHEAVAEAREMFARGSSLNSYDAKVMIMGCVGALSTEQRGVLYNAELTLATAGRSIGEIPTYHRVGSAESDAHQMVAELGRLIVEAKRVRKECWKMHMKSGREEVGAALANIRV